MMYLIYRSFQKLWINKKTYFFIMLELAIGISVVMCGICSTYSAQSKLELCKQQIGTDGAVIEYYENGTASTDFPISVEDYITIRDSYSETDISYLLFAHSIYLTQASSNVKNVSFISMDAASFARFFGFAPQDDTIYLGSQIAEDSEKEGITFFEEWFSWGGSNVKVGEYDVPAIEKLAPSTKTIVVGVSWDLDVSTAIVLPEKYMNVLQDNGDHPSQHLRVMINSDTVEADVLYDILQTLQETHSGYSYRIAEQYFELQKSIIDLTQGIRIFAWIAWFALIISMVGIIGILLIYMEKRKRELAIILALGGTRTTIFKEIFFEVFSLCSISGILGIIITIFIIPHLSTNVFTASFQWISVFAMLGIVLAIPIVSSVCIIGGIRSIYPTKILKQ